MKISGLLILLFGFPLLHGCGGGGGGGGSSSGPGVFFNQNKIVFSKLTQNASGMGYTEELWLSDGSDPGTHLLKNINT
jgi:hypothetical protein